MAKGDTMVEHRLDTEGADPLMLAGVNDRNMHEVSNPTTNSTTTPTYACFIACPGRL